MIVRVPADVPIHRASVGADPTNMGNRQPDNFHDNFKPYVYRGLGFDLLTPELGEDWERGTGAPPPSRPKPKPKPKPRKARASRRRPRLYPYYGPEHVLPPPPPPSEPRPFDIMDETTWGNLPRLPKPKRKVRPTPGWEPMKGDDIDALLNDLA